MAERFTLHILGSASAKPNLKRNSSAQLLQAAGRLFLIDCAEGTQTSVQRQASILKSWTAENREQGFKRPGTSAIDAIFISHIHGDHVFGLFPLLSTMALNGREKPLMVFGPNNLGPVITFYKSFWGQKDPYEIKFTPLKMNVPEVIMEIPGLQVEAFPLKHAIDCYGYIFRECPHRTPQGDVNDMRSYAYCSDTAPFAELSSWVRGVSLLYHEGTYLREDSSKARARFHSTVEDAATCARDAQAGRLLLGHYSSSIAEETISDSYICQARAIFPDSTAVSDGDIYDIPAINQK